MHKWLMWGTLYPHRQEVTDDHSMIIFFGHENPTSQKIILDRYPPTHDVGPASGENYVIVKLFFFLWGWKPNLIT